jgi:pimeloyl-ACP methyl ester carboxylesterase
MDIQNPVIVIPGITATDLVDDYPLKADEIWTMVFNKDYERLALHPDDLRYEAVEPAHVVAGQLFPIYNDLIRALRHELSARADRPTPVFAFPYDWRMDVRDTATRLGRFVDEVIARTKLLKHYAGANALQVDLVGHSMGGLVITEYLAARGRRSRVGKVVTIGTPYLGSIEAIVKMTTGMSLITGPEPREREREAARVTPALYQLFPSYRGAIADRTGRDVDIFDCRHMQKSIVDSLAEFVRIYSVSTPASARRARAVEILMEMLAGARRHRNIVDTFRPADAGLRQDDWLAVIGVGERTRINMVVDGRQDARRFTINEDQRVNTLNSRNPESHQTGDGTVPLPGARPPFLPSTRLVCVQDDDLEFLELRDRLLVGLGGFHGLLPRINLVQRLVAKHLCPTYRGRVWGRRLPGARAWNPPISGLEERAY